MTKVHSGKTGAQIWGLLPPGVSWPGPAAWRLPEGKGLRVPSLLSRGGGGGSLGPSLPQGRCRQTARGRPRLGGTSVKLWKRGGIMRRASRSQRRCSAGRGGDHSSGQQPCGWRRCLCAWSGSRWWGCEPSPTHMKVSSSEPPAPHSGLQLLPLPAGHSSGGGGSHQWAIPLPHSPASSRCLINVGYTELGFLEA